MITQKTTLSGILLILFNEKVIVRYNPYTDAILYASIPGTIGLHGVYEIDKIIADYKLTSCDL